jgi:hypothetical protein
LYLQFEVYRNSGVKNRNAIVVYDNENLEEYNHLKVESLDKLYTDFSMVNWQISWIE